MRNLEISQDTFDRKTFKVDIGRNRTRTAKVCSYDDEGDGTQVLWIMQVSACIKSSYSEADIQESERLRIETPVKHNDIVEIEGKQYRVHVNGDYSDLGKLYAV